MNADSSPIRSVLLFALMAEAEAVIDVATELDRLCQAAACPDPQTAGAALAEIYRGDVLQPLRAALLEAERHIHDLTREHQARIASAELDAERRLPLRESA